MPIFVSYLSLNCRCPLSGVTDGASVDGSDSGWSWSAEKIRVAHIRFISIVLTVYACGVNVALDAPTFDVDK